MSALAKFLDVMSAILKKGTIAMYARKSDTNPYERDRVGRILAHKRAVALRVARQFDNPESAMAREVRDILEHMPERAPVGRSRKVGA